MCTVQDRWKRTTPSHQYTLRVVIETHPLFTETIVVVKISAKKYSPRSL